MGHHGMPTGAYTPPTRKSPRRNMSNSERIESTQQQRMIRFENKRIKGI